MILIMTTLGLATANVDEPCDDLKRDMIALELFYKIKRIILNFVQRLNGISPISKCTKKP